MLRGAISGFGEVAAEAHLAGWCTRPEVAIVAIHDPVSERRHHAINLVRNARVYDDLDLMLDGEALDFVDIASPPAFHGAAVRKALEAGANVLVEKPLCLFAAEFEDLAALAARKSRVLMCVHNWKHAPAYRRARELIESGRLGDLRYISIVRLRDGPAGAGGGTGIGFAIARELVPALAEAEEQRQQGRAAEHVAADVHVRADVEQDPIQLIPLDRRHITIGLVQDAAALD